MTLMNSSEPLSHCAHSILLCSALTERDSLSLHFIYIWQLVFFFFCGENTKNFISCVWLAVAESVRRPFARLNLCHHFRRRPCVRHIRLTSASFQITVSFFPYHEFIFLMNFSKKRKGKKRLQVFKLPRPLCYTLNLPDMYVK